MIIKKGTLDEAKEFERLIPEFLTHTSQEKWDSVKEKKHLVLFAQLDGKKVGFKVGYERDGNFYTWIGGVLPEYRKKHVALQLANYQEEWARKEGYKKITLKTKNKYRNMLLFAIKNGFKIVEYEDQGNVENNPIHLEKII